MLRMAAAYLQCLTLTLAACGLLCSSRSQSAEAGATRPRAALVIGNAHYGAVTPLRNTLNDAHDICDSLGELGYTTSCFTDVKDAREFRARIQQFAASLKPRSEVLFYYAGHGIQMRGESYLVPVRAKLRAQADVAAETVPLAFVLTQLLQARHYLDIVILDACRNNPWASAPQGMSSGLAPLSVIPRDTMIMYGTASNDVSDDGEGRNGTLTKNLLANLKTPGLTADEFFKRVSEGVQSDTSAAVGHTQVPALYTNFNGEFCFAGCIDRVARTELARMQKAHEEQLAQATREADELEASNREIQAQLDATTTSKFCDASEEHADGRCFVTDAQTTANGIQAAFAQRGLTVRGGYLGTTIDGSRSGDDPKDRNLTDVLSVTATITPVGDTGHSAVSITARRRVLLHDEHHHWTSADIIIPIATSTDYKEVVKQDVAVTDPVFFRDLYAAIERNLRGGATLDSVRTPTAPAPVDQASPATVTVTVTDATQ
ncbi:MAG TPA: caspase family protein [Steroidobacteraceae bacterium]|nr:caspase family protein [Steroidobacteraceae bacterium]